MNQSKVILHCNDMPTNNSASPQTIVFFPNLVQYCASCLKKPLSLTTDGLATWNMLYNLTFKCSVQGWWLLMSGFQDRLQFSIDWLTAEETVVPTENHATFKVDCLESNLQT